MISSVSEQLLQLSRGLLGDSGDSEASLSRAQLNALLGKLNLVSRDEFDAQRAVLERTRTKVEQLEACVAELEQQLQAAKN